MENTNFKGKHYVKCYIIDNRLGVA
ncbi:hypothetical protein KLH93_17140 [Bacillus inaquosorum]|nr:hypothetical protein [Bacillus inaquosorum]MBT3119415.1 hypothetical protein [Bacillus inaquosorum]MBT3124227.1 hypothetical protein [Bacillus inaquosorum]MBV2240873.1 hypothetical protein [Bacillus inaquosorum]